ncbi:MAG: tyrosine-type recombinase/integrase [Nitrospira sp.]|nr:tyrosine-type recombinase/integrase [Nitrospira sp.]
MKAPLTKSKIDSLLPGSKDVVVHDTAIPGFGLKITPTGHKTYILQYRMGGREFRKQRYTIGAHGIFTPDQARKEAIRLRGLIAGGVDPAEAKRHAQASTPFKTFAQQYLEQHAKVHKKPRSIVEDERNLNNHIYPILGNRSLETISRADIANLHHRLRAAPIAANRTLSLLTTMFNLAERWGFRPDGSNPCKHIQRFKENRRERFLSADELARLGRAMTQAEEKQSHSAFVLGCFRLLIFSGARLGEILSLQWEHVNIEERRINLPDSKTGKKVIHLNAPALAVLDAMPRIEGNPFVCCGQRKGKSLTSVHRIWFEIREAAGLPDLRLHDLRHSFASIGVGSGASLYIIGTLLGHSLPATTARYAHLHADPLREVSETIAAQIQAAMNTQREHTPVVHMDVHAKNTRRSMENRVH